MGIDYLELAALADRVLEVADESVEKLANLLDTLEEDIRRELLVSDLLNALQVFYYFFRELPSELVEERLMLTPASELVTGVPFEDIDLCRLVFVVRDGKACILVTDGSCILASFCGIDAYRQALGYIEEHPC